VRAPGQVALLRFPQSDLSAGKPRPVLLIVRVPGGRYEDWLVCMLTTQLHQALPGFDEILDESQPDFVESGVRVRSLIRISRLAVVSADMLLGNLGTIGDERLMRIRKTLADWIEAAPKNE